MGSRHVYVHFIVFTQFSMHKEELKQTSLMRDVCCICSALIQSKKKVLSLCLRLMGGTNSRREWEYAVVFAVCCGACKPKHIKRFATILLRNDDIARVEQFIDQHAFQGRCVEVENFLYGSRDNQGAVFHALVDNYLWRLNVINCKVPALCRLFFEANECFFCKSGTDLKKCDKCKCISCCDLPECVMKLERHHPDLCLALSRGHVFHVDTLMDRIFHVERSLEGRCLEYKSDTLEMSAEELNIKKGDE